MRQPQLGNRDFAVSNWNWDRSCLRCTSTRIVLVRATSTSTVLQSVNGTFPPTHADAAKDVGAGTAIQHSEALITDNAIDTVEAVSVAVLVRWRPHCVCAHPHEHDLRRGSITHPSIGRQRDSVGSVGRVGRVGSVGSVGSVASCRDDDSDS